MPNSYYADIMPLMDLAESRVVQLVMRETIGWQRLNCVLSLADVVKRTNLSRTSVWRGIKDAEERGTFRREVAEGGMKFTILLREATEAIVETGSFKSEHSEQPLNAPTSFKSEHAVFKFETTSENAPYMSKKGLKKTPCASASQTAGDLALFGDLSTAEGAPSEEKPAPPEPVGAVRFWEAWPAHERKRGRGKVLAWWRSRKPSATLEVAIMAAVEAQKRGKAWCKDGGRFVPMPISWLNSVGWEDEVIAWTLADEHYASPNGRQGVEVVKRVAQEGIKRRFAGRDER